MRRRGVGRNEWSRCLHCDFIQLSSIDHGAITTIRIIALAFIIIPKWTLIHPMMIMEIATFLTLVKVKLKCPMVLMVIVLSIMKVNMRDTP